MAFMFPQPQQAMTPEGISRQRMIANALMQQGMDASPVQHWSQGLNRVAQALLGGYQNKQANEADATLQRKKELDAATEKAKAEAEKRNTPEFKFGPDGSLYNWNPYMAEGGKPALLSRATQKRDEMTAYQKAQLERQNKLDNWRMKKDDAEATAEPSFKEYQTKDANLAARMKAAEQNIGYAVGETKGPGGVANPDPTDPTAYGNKWWPDDSRWNSAGWRQFDQAKKEWMAALLRKDTGAAVTETEFEIYDKAYFPQPNDDPTTVTNKKKAREQVAADLATGSGGAFEHFQKKRQAPKLDGPALAPEGTYNSFEDLAPQLKEGTVFRDNETGKRYQVKNGEPVEIGP